MDEKRYRILRFVAGLHEATGWVVVIAGPALAGVIYVLQADQKYGWKLYGIGLTTILLVVGLVCVALGFPIIAFGQLIRVFIDIESDTRATAEAIRQLRWSLRPGTPGGKAGGPDIFDLP